MVIQMADAKKIVRIDYKAYFAEADKLGFRRIVVPRHNLKSLGAPARHSLEIIPADKVEDALRVLFG